MNGDEKTPLGGRLPSRTVWVLVAFLAIVGFFLITEHRAHLYGFLPYLLLLACPLLHWLLHSGHGGHGDRQHGQGGDKE